MFRRHSPLFLFLLLCWAAPAPAGPLEDGYAAWERKDYATARRLWEPLAAKNDPDALFNLGLLYKNGQGVARDYKQAMAYFKQAALYGSVDAAYNLGVMYLGREYGYPSKKDALYWWQQAAEAGHPESQYNLGVMYAYGMGTKADGKQAIEWWTRAARQGNRNAIEALIRVYEEGLFGIPKDPGRAAKWKQLLGK